MPIVTSNFGRGSMKLDLDSNRRNENAVLDCLKSGRHCEPDVAGVFVNVLREGDVVIDVGAHIGYFTVLASVLVGPKGHVIAFEPSAGQVERLRANLGHNDSKNVTIVEKVVTNQIGDVEFFVNAEDWGELWSEPWPGSPKELPPPMRRVLPGTTLDAELEKLGLPGPKLIKIDVEGAEQRVLEGARGLITRHQPPFIIAELHDFGLEKLGASQASLRGFIEGLGYSTFGLYYAGTLPRFVPAATRIQGKVILNLLFSKPEWIGEYWQTVAIDPNAAG